MKTLTKITLVGAAFSVILHLYLTLHYYPIKFGFSSGPSICSVNATFDCDAVAASQYSAVFDIPVAIFGAAVNLIIFILVLGAWLGWSDHPERLKRWGLILISSAALSSVIMGLISTRLHYYCLFCISLYFISFIMLEAYRRTLEEPFFANLGRDVTKLWTESRGILVAIVFIPIIAVVMHRTFLETYGVTELDALVQRTVREWQSAPHYEFNAKPSLAMGPERDQAKLVISEFADFRCHHCKNASPSLDNFAKSNPDVRLEFYTFPLDGDCNEMIPDKNGISCRLAEAVHCAEKQGFGWALHHALFEHQDEVNDARRIDQTDEKIRAIALPLGIKEQELFQCIADPQTVDSVRLQAKQGALAKVQGTPTIYANGRPLERGQLIPVLEAVKSSIK